LTVHKSYTSLPEQSITRLKSISEQFIYTITQIHK